MQDGVYCTADETTYNKCLFRESKCTPTTTLLAHAEWAKWYPVPAVIHLEFSDFLHCGGAGGAGRPRPTDRPTDRSFFIKERDAFLPPRNGGELLLRSAVPFQYPEIGESGPFAHFRVSAWLTSP